MTSNDFQILMFNLSFVLCYFVGVHVVFSFCYGRCSLKMAVMWLLSLFLFVFCSYIVSGGTIV